MKAPCTCRTLRQWAQDPDVPITERDGVFVLGRQGAGEPRWVIQFCPFCGESGWPAAELEPSVRPCACGVMEAIVKEHPALMEFDAEMNEFHILHDKGRGKLQVNHCFACGGAPPPSLRHTFFESPGEEEFAEASRRMSGLRDEKDFEREFGVPTHVFDPLPLAEKDVAIYGMKPIRRQWTFEPPNSRISFCLQLMEDGTYQKMWSARHKKEC